MKGRVKGEKWVTRPRGGGGVKNFGEKLLAVDKRKDLITYVDKPTHRVE